MPTIKVVVRTRPTSNFAPDVHIDAEAQTIVINQDKGSVDGTHSQSALRFQYHQVFHNASQNAVYEGLARDAVQGAIEGTNGTIMSLGQTGSGKTFTMIGDMCNYRLRGVAPRALAQVFSEISARAETAFRVTCTYLEIYNERIFDLLADPADNEPRGDYAVAEDHSGTGGGGGGTFVRGLTEVAAVSEQDALNLLYAGELMRTTAQHNLNRRSNRSHSIFTLHLTQRARGGLSERVLTSKLHLVDLAGSERLKKALDLERLEGRAVADDTIRKESMHINQSLSYLEQCVVALARRSPGHVPYRQSKLTSVLRDALGGNCNTLLFACVWGEAAHLEETVSTLRLASRMMRVQNETRPTEVMDPAQTLKKQEKMIRDLKQELLMHDALAERSGVMYDPFTSDQRADLRRQLERYLTAKDQEEEDSSLPVVASIRHFKEVCHGFKTLMRELSEDAERQLHAAALATSNSAVSGDRSSGDSSSGGAGSGGNSRGLLQRNSRMLGSHDPATEVGVLDTAESGFGLGRAADNARPTSTEYLRSAASPAQRARFEAWTPPAAMFPVSPAAAYDSVTFPAAATATGLGGLGGLGGFADDAALSPGRPDSAQLYEDFKAAEGATAAAAVRAARAQLRSLRAEAAAAAAAVNEAKRQIDAEQEALNRWRKAAGATADDVVDGEEFRLIRECRDAKQRYKSAYAELQQVRTTLDAAAGSANQSTRDLVAAFERWRGTDGTTGSIAGRDGSDEPNARPSHRAAAAPAPAPACQLPPSGSCRPGGSGGGQPLEQLGSPSAAPEANDKLDENEVFERMEMERIMSRDPEALAFFQAQKARIATRSQNTRALRRLHRVKRSHR